MTDMEKVIRGWERCRKCHDVPMMFSESYRDCEYTRGMYCRQDILIEDTLALLKEQKEDTETDKLKNMCRVLFNRCRAVGSANGMMCVWCGMKKECEEMHSI